MQTGAKENPVITGQGALSNRRQAGIGKFIAMFSLLFMVGCKIQVQVPQGGQVVSDQGLVCAAGTTCLVEVTSTNHEETFHAEAAPGYVFTGWKQQHTYMCGGSALACAISTVGFAGNATLESALADDNLTVYLEPIFEADDGRYDLAQWQAFLAELGGTQYRSDNFLYQDIPNAANCDPGTLTAQATFRFHIALNLIRNLHNLPWVSYDAFYNTQMQEANLVQQANNYFTHYPKQGDTCYTAGAAAGAGSANISWSSWQGDPARYALGWTNDNHNVSSLMAAGHRRWVLNPNLGYTSYGQVGGYAAMKVFGFGSQPGYTLPEDLEYVAFPYRNYPYVMVEQGSYPTPWSISMVPASGNAAHPYFDNATVTVQEVATGNSLTVSDIHTDTSGYGLRNFLSWMVAGWSYDTDYLVTIDNIQMPDGSTRTVQYPVEIDLEEFN